MGLQRSDVVFYMPGASDGTWRRYGATLEGWGGFNGWFFGHGDQTVEQWAERVRAAHEMGMRFNAKTCFMLMLPGFVETVPDWEDSICRDLDGGMMDIPWVKDWSYLGRPWYWPCSNAPRYREYLRLHVRTMLEAAPVDGLMIDGYMGSAQTEFTGGCYCRHCTTSFREWLGARADPARLQAAGVGDLAGFDYGALLRSRGVSVATLQAHVDDDPSPVPLREEFREFQYRAACGLVREMRAFADGLAGRRLDVCVNSVLAHPKWLVVAPDVDYFCCEVQQFARGRTLSDEPVFVYALAEAIGKPVACTAFGWDWAVWGARRAETTDLVRAWIAQAYACGQVFMTPWRLWAYDQETKTTTWPSDAPGEFDHLYRFVRATARLFDGHAPVARVGVLYDSRAVRLGSTVAARIVAALSHANVPFRLLAAGDDWLPARLGAADLDGLDTVVAPTSDRLDPAQGAVLAGAGSRLVRWDGDGPLPRSIHRPIAIEGGGDVLAVPRSDGRDAVLHLVNRVFDRSTGRVAVQRDVRVRIGGSVFGRPVRSAVCHAPDRTPRELRVVHGRLTVPELATWAVLELR